MRNDEKWVISPPSLIQSDLIIVCMQIYDSLSLLCTSLHRDHPGTPSKLPPPPPPFPPQFVSEGSDAQRAQLAAHVQHKQAHTPTVAVDMRPLREEACLTPQAKSAHISASTALDRASMRVPSSPQPISMLGSKVHHQHVMNRQGAEEPLYPGDLAAGGGGGGGGGGVKQCGRCVRGGTKPPAVFVQRHSQRQVS